MAIDYSWCVDSTSPGDMGVSIDDGRIVEYLDVVPDAVAPAVKDLVGDVAYEVEDGNPRLRRALPKCHPIFPSFFVDRVASIRGRGSPTKTAVPLLFTTFEA